MVEVEKMVARVEIVYLEKLVNLVTMVKMTWVNGLTR